MSEDKIASLLDELKQLRLAFYDFENHIARALLEDRDSIEMLKKWNSEVGSQVDLIKQDIYNFKQKGK